MRRRRRVWWPLALADHAGWFGLWTLLLVVVTTAPSRLWF